MAKPAKFTVDDGVEYAPNSQPPSVRKAIALLETMRFGALLTARGLAGKIGVCEDRIKNLGRLFEHYRKKDGNRFLYGNPKTIKALNEQES